jgi:hypothetical protein
MKHHTKTFSNKQQRVIMKPDTKSTVSPSDLWKARQLREHRRENGLCFKCGDKFAPGHKCVIPPTTTTLNQLEAIMGQAFDGGSFMFEEVLTAFEV